MERGKEICKALREIRRQIALENDIEYITSECRHKGNCSGTCPKCEAEVRYLEEKLASRRRVGKITRVVGISLGLATIVPAVFTSCVTEGDPVTPDTEQTEGDPVVPPTDQDKENSTVPQTEKTEGNPNQN